MNFRRVPTGKRLKGKGGRQCVSKCQFSSRFSFGVSRRGPARQKAAPQEPGVRLVVDLHQGTVGKLAEGRPRAALAAPIQPVGMQPQVECGRPRGSAKCRRDRAAKSLEILAPAFATRPVSGRERRCLVEEE